MTEEELERVFRLNKWLIFKRTSAAGIKKMTLGNEKLADLIAEIADSYALDDTDRRLLLPTIGIDVHDTVSDLASRAKNVPHAVKGAKIINDARKTGTIIETGRQFITGGMEAAEVASKGIKIAKAAKTASTVGRTLKTVSTVPTSVSRLGWISPVVSKAATPLMIAQAAYAVGSAGYFGFKARRFNRDCYALLKNRLGEHAEAASATAAA